jgi:serine/threonine protein kinase
MSDQSIGGETSPSLDSGGGGHYFALTKGTKLFEFEIESVLGHGGFGITYKATDTLLQETVAIKEFLPNDLAIRVSDATVRAKSDVAQNDFQAGLRAFLDEARLIARIRHPNVVQVRRFFEQHGTGYLVLTYEEGQTLSKRLNAGPLSEAELRTVLFGLLDGLEAIHERAILHRDLKPSNVILRPDGTPVLIDFGAARDFKGRHSYSVTAIVAPGYSPPEQYGVGGRQGPWTDLYALGAIAYRCATGVAPADSIRRLRDDPLVPAILTPAISAAAGKYDMGILRAIDWMLTIDEAKRPASVKQLRPVLHGHAVGVIPDDTPTISTSKASASAKRSAAPDVASSHRDPAARSAPGLRMLWALSASLLVIAVVAALGLYNVGHLSLDDLTFKHPATVACDGGAAPCDDRSTAARVSKTPQDSADKAHDRVEAESSRNKQAITQNPAAPVAADDPKAVKTISVLNPSPPLPPSPIETSPQPVPASTPTTSPPVPPVTNPPVVSAPVTNDLALITDPGLLSEIRDRLYELNYDPGRQDGTRRDLTEQAIREFESKTNLPSSGQPTLRLLRRLRDVEALKPWGAIVFQKDTGKWGISWGHGTRTTAVSSAQLSCNSECQTEISFYGRRCGAFAYSSSGWALVTREDAQRAKDAAVTECSTRGGNCRVVVATCADGTDRYPAGK